MRLFAGILATAILLGGAGDVFAAVRIGNDRGGRIGTYADKYRQMRDSGESVIIDGLCAAACTIVLGAVPRDKICLTKRARFGFKAAWDMDADGRQIVNTGATQALYTLYPLDVKRWIDQHGGLTQHMIVLQGTQLQLLYRPCTF